MLRYKVPKETKRKVKSISSTRKRLKEEYARKIKTPKEKLILKVYRDKNEYKVDIVSARALGITKGRQIIGTETPYFTIDQDMVERLEHDDRYEVRFMDEKGKEEIPEEISLEEIFERLDITEYGIGVHGIASGSDEEKATTADSILKTGLQINNNSNSILSTAISLGTDKESDLPSIQRQIVEYYYGNGLRVNVVIAVPIEIESENGEKIFLGFPEKNLRTSGQQYEEHCVLDLICSRMKGIPQEFILGYYRDNPDGSGAFIRNPKHYSSLEKEEREELFGRILANMNDRARDINDMVQKGDIERLRNSRNFFKNRSLPTYLLDSAIKHIEKKQEKTGRRLLHVEKTEIREMETESEPSPSISKRRILLSSIKGIRSGDVEKARGIFILGREEPENTRGQDPNQREEE